ncbi:serine hydrolase FSH [Xylariaceae sp. FL0662B]|nr:serine hydrolase FSH [Xylariaceae sp. FL0662B]
MLISLESNLAHDLKKRLKIIDLPSTGVMRILCLHGADSNGYIFQSELASILSNLLRSIADLSFDFLDGPLQSSTHAVGNSPHDAKTNYKFYEALNVKDILKAHKWLTTKLLQSGPYDGVIAFSHGAALVSSYLLYQQWYEHESPPPFRFAAFISGNIPLMALKDLGVTISDEAERVVAEAELQYSQGLGPLPTHTTRARRAVFNSDDCFGLNLNSIPLELKIRIPTVHVWGEKDPMLPASVQLAGLCDPYIRKIHIHPGAHEIPRDGKSLEELAVILEWCIQRATWPGQTQV